MVPNDGISGRTLICYTIVTFLLHCHFTLILVILICYVWRKKTPNRIKDVPK